MTTLLGVRGLDVSYGHIAAVKGVDLALKTSEIISLVGANDAGKSTTLLALSSLIPKSQGNMHGQILFEGEDVTQWSIHKRVEHGIVQVAEGRAALTTMTVREDLELGARTKNARKDRDQIVSNLERVLHLFPRPKERIGSLAGSLSDGEQQMLAIGRALMACLHMPLLDEPSMGFAPVIVQKIFRALRTTNIEGLTVFLIEQNVRQALKIAQHDYVLETGRIVLADSGKNLLGSPRVLEACLDG